jgi:hypothetical protein
MTPRSKMNQNTSVPWPSWLLRFIASDDRSAFNDLVWSVGGSPPYGGVSYEEAEAVYNLLEQFMGPGRAPEGAYEAIRRFIRDKPERLDALEVFRRRDCIASSPEDYSEEDVVVGIALSEKLGHAGVRAYFLTLQAQLRYKAGEIPEAKRLTFEALPVLLDLAARDSAYIERATIIGQNAVSFASLDGDFEAARKIKAILTQGGFL